MKKTHHKILIIALILLVVGGSYTYFSHSLTSEASGSSSLTSSLGANNSILPSSSKIASDIAFISTLASLSHITIDTSLFSNKSFKNLKDNTVFLADGPTGRVNPFAPVDNNLAQISLNSPVSTNNPLDIKSDSAVLSGTINSIVKVSNAYFEYGPDNKLGKTTSDANVSLIGGFVSSLSGLKTNTSYFYKACAKINGSVSCGDINSFTTAK